MELKFSPDIALPLSVVTQKLAFIARSGAGKTYGASKMAEEMLSAGAQIVVIDPVGVWHGLRLAADGKSNGFDIPILGGEHGDVPLDPASGALVARMIVEKKLSAVLDISYMRKGQRKQFATAFAEELMHLKKANRGPLHVFLEEAQTLVPQRIIQSVGGDREWGEARMLGAFEDLIKLGRNFGIGCTLISQRPQSVNKDALNQTEALFVLQTNGAQERKAIMEWVLDKGIDSKVIADDLPSLPIGTAYLWSPQWLKVLKKVRIGKKRTYDASATPDFSVQAVQPRALDAKELGQLQEAMKESLEKARASDPKALQQRVRELEAEISKLKSNPVTREVPKVEVQEVPAIKGRDLEMADKVAGKLGTAIEQLRKAVQDLETHRDVFSGGVSAVCRAQNVPDPSSGNGPETIYERRTVAAPPVRGRTIHMAHLDDQMGIEKQKLVGAGGWPGAKAAAPKRSQEEIGGIQVKKGAREMLEALATQTDYITRAQLGTLAGKAHTGGTFADYLSALRRAELIQEDGNSLAITRDGLRFLGFDSLQPKKTTDELVSLWSQHLKAGARRMLDVLVSRYPNWLHRAELADAVQMEVSGGTFADYLSSLRRAGLIEEEKPDNVRASALLFP